MTMQILDIVLYNAQGDIRRLTFKPGSVNIITGASATGKSAIIEIVEYCLGRESFTVPAGTIRETVLWYGLRLQFPSEQVFIARSAPPMNRRSSTDVYLDMASSVDIPEMEVLRAVTNPSDLNLYLTQLIGISANLTTPPEGQTRRPLEATLRHALLLVFQQQDEIANRKFLFHRQGEPFLPQSIKDTLPYFLGAVEEDRLAKQQELKTAKRELLSAEKRFRELEMLRGEGISRATSLVREAEMVGILAPTLRPGDIDGLAQVLQSALIWQQSEMPVSIRESIIDLQRERATLQQDYRTIQSRIREAQEFSGEQEGFTFEVQQQRARLQSVGLLNVTEPNSTFCPLCQTSLAEMIPAVNDLQQAFEKLGAQLASVSRDRPRLREFIDSESNSLSDVRKQLQDNRQAMDSLIAQEVSARDQQDLESSRARVAGRISLYLESLPQSTDQSFMLNQVEEAKATVDKLVADLRDENVVELLTSILNILGQRITKWSTDLELEHSEFPLRLDLTKLNVVSDTDFGPIPLDQMGSGGNWVGYHLTAHMALHQWFVQKKRPVPRFLFLDQPTQVYYPPDQDTNGTLEDLPNDDRLAVIRMFRWLFNVVAELAPDFQVIITDHADIDEPWFREAVVERWRNGNALIPVNWVG